MEGREDVQLYRGAGCPHCFDTGYRGRTAVTETLIMTPTLRRLVAEGKPRAEIEQELKKPGSGYTSIRENAVKLALAGITTLEEILRVINEED